MKKYIENIKSSLILQVINLLTGFTVSIIVARELGTVNYGEASYIILVINIVSGYYHLGIINGSSLMYREKKKNGLILSSNLIFCFISVSVISILLYVFKGKIFNEINNKVFLMIVLGILSLSSFKVLNLYYISQERIKDVSKKVGILKLCYTIIILFIFLMKKLTLETYFLSYLAYLFFQFILLWRDKEQSLKKNIDFKIIKEEFKVGFWIFLGSFFIFLNYRIDQIFIKFYLGNAMLGVYSAAVNLSELLFIVSASVSAALLGNLINTEEKEVKYKIVIKTLKMTSGAIIILILIGILMRPLIPIIYGSDYDSAKNVIVILFIGNFFANIGKVVSSYFITEGKTYIHAIICFFPMAINIALNYFFIKIYGIYGAALASCISYLIYGIVYYIFLKREVDLNRYTVEKKKGI